MTHPTINLNNDEGLVSRYLVFKIRTISVSEIIVTRINQQAMRHCP